MSNAHMQASSDFDEDDAPDLSTPEWRVKFAQADLREGGKIVRRGRPKLEKPKLSVHLRLDEEIVAYFRNTGPGWQTRINDTLREIVAKQPKALDRVFATDGSFVGGAKVKATAGKKAPGHPMLAKGTMTPGGMPHKKWGHPIAARQTLKSPAKKQR